MKRKISIFTLAGGLGLALLCSGCWQVAAAKAAKKRTHETGYVVGTIEDQMGIEDPHHRKQRKFDFSETAPDTTESAEK